MPCCACGRRRRPPSWGSAVISTIARSRAASRSRRTTRVVLDGEFRASIDLAQPRRSTADGTLEIADLDLGKYLDVPVAIERATLDAAGQALHVRDGVVRLAGERLAVGGTVESREQGYAIDARVSAEAVDAARLIGALPLVGRGKASPDAPWNLPVEGRIAVNAASAAYGGRVLEAVAAVVSLAPNRVHVEASQARLCGIAIPFNAVLVPGSVAVSARLAARKQPLAETVSCLAGDHLAVTGTYDLDAEFSASGPIDSVVGATRGSFRFVARAGRIHRAAVLSRALAVDEVAARAQVTAADVTKGGFAYDEIAVAGTVEADRVRLDQGVLDSPALGATGSGEVGLSDGRLALQGLLAPLDTMHRVMRRVPILGPALSTPLVVVPVSIGGSLRDPEVKVLHAAAVTTTLINLMTVRFLFPVYLFNQVAGEAQREP